MDMSMYDLTGKVAIITGSTRGIGNAIAKLMADHGAAVVITGRKQEACDKVADETRQPAARLWASPPTLPLLRLVRTW